MSDLIERTEQMAFVPEAEFTETALVLPQTLTFERWEQVGETLGRIHRASGWWIGDWLNFGERAYGERYSQAMEATGLDYQTLANYAWVAKAIEVSRRRENLSYSHHKELAGLEPAEQDEWLDMAESQEMSKADLRKAIKDQEAPAPPSNVVEVALTVPTEEWGRWADAAESEGLGVATWLRQVANRAAG